MLHRLSGPIGGLQNRDTVCAGAWWLTPRDFLLDYASVSVFGVLLVVGDRRSASQTLGRSPRKLRKKMIIWNFSDHWNSLSFPPLEFPLV